MATLTIGTASGGFFNFRGANTTPYAMGSSVVVATTGGDIDVSTTYEGIIISQLTFQCSGYTTTSSLYGNIWNSSGVSQTASSAVSAATDTTAPFGSKTFNLSDQYFTRQTLYAGYSRAAASPTAWDVVNGDNTTRIGNTAGSAPSGLTGTGTGTVYRRLVGTLTYVLYDQGQITRSVTTSNKTSTINFSGANGTHLKTISINWGDGSTATSPSPLTVAASAIPVDQSRTYTLAGQYPIATTISYSSSAVGIPDITFSNTGLTVPAAPTSLTATVASSSQINLSWTAPNYALGNANGTVASTGGSNGTVTYQLYRTPSGGSATLVYNSTGTSFNDTGLSASTSYSYTVYATNNTGQGPVSNTASATTSAGVPGQVQGFNANATSESNVDLYWTARPVGESVTGYQLYRNGSLIASPTGTTYSDSGLAFETSYTYTIYAVNAIGSSATPATASATTQVGGKSVIWNGTQTVGSYPKVWNGSSWITGQSKVWNGTSWVKGLGVTVPGPVNLSTSFVNPDPPSAGSYSWSITPGFNGNSPITGYLVQFWRVDNETGDYIEATSSGQSGSFPWYGAASYILAYAINAVGQGT
jgi:hypothetical protein